jgi:CRISPR-associated protein Csm4
MKRPDLPLKYLFPMQGKDRGEVIKDRKEKKRLKWMRVEEDLCIDLKKASYLSDTDLAAESHKQSTELIKSAMKSRPVQGISVPFEQQHNTINRATSTTGEGMFAPYTVSAFSYYPETELAVFCLIDEQATDIEHVCLALERIGTVGFGRDASTGLGRFMLGESSDISISELSGADACYALSPFVPEKDAFSKIYYSPFIRFGRHGDVLAKSANPFKNPVIMADEGAVLIPSNRKVLNKPYMGTGITGVSKAEPRTIHQGYAIHLPIRAGGLS